ncbi:MAG TPA: ABC transporter ATP-binding protein [Conexibacter sp.]|jgi:peptide/nickel transport system ATP-binding protein|nr:ABC transporter ATP-binding protein [Conexibacter sp.]
MSVVEVQRLRVALVADPSVNIVEDVDFTMEAGEILGLVGESGCGKTTVSTALLGYTRKGARQVGGEVRVDGRDIAQASPEELRRLRGKVVSYIPQDPAAALNPARRVLSQLRELLVHHEPDCSTEQAEERIATAMEEAGLATDEGFLRRFPHQLSGGQQQRVCIAMAFLLRPKVIVLDEPTTGLDVSTQAQVLRTVRRLSKQLDVAALYVTHDLSVVANLADRLMVMYAGRVAELGPTAEVVRQAAHPYTRRLVAAIPEVHSRRTLETIPGRAPAPGQRPEACTFAPRCEFAEPRCLTGEPALREVAPGRLARCVRGEELADRPLAARVATAMSAARDGAPILSVREAEASYGDHRVLAGVSFEVRRGECVALVGESGSGKTTLSRSIVGLHALSGGEVVFDGQPLEGLARRRPDDVRRRVQYIFQSPYNSLNRRRAVGDSIAAPAHVFFSLSRKERRVRVDEALERVSLTARHAHRFPDELSGGERQRVAIARALICQPDVLICDEITSALDVSVQASIVRVLGRLQEEEQLAMVFVTHNLALVRSIADSVVILDKGRIVEGGPTARVLDAPEHDYTRRLLADTPSLDRAESGTRAS